MKFKVDENLPKEVADILKEAGYDAATVLAQGLGGAYDQLIAEACRREQRILLTLDLDFANIYAYPPQLFPGLMVLRLQRQDKHRLLDLVRSAIPLLTREPIENSLWIVEETGVRIHTTEPEEEPVP